MSDIIIRSAVDADEAQLLAAIADEQDYERALHDTRKPGAEIATAYLAYLRTSVARKQGCLLVAEWSRVFAGYAACWVEDEDNVAETADSNRFGYIADTYVVPAFRGRGVVSALIEAAGAQLRARTLRRMRIVVLAKNASALRPGPAEWAGAALFRSRRGHGHACVASAARGPDGFAFCRHRVAASADAHTMREHRACAGALPYRLAGQSTSGRRELARPRYR